MAEVVFASSAGEDVYQCLPIVVNRGISGIDNICIYADFMSIL